MPNNSNSPSYSMALKGRKSLPNRLSSVNSYNFVIRENCRKCKTTVPNCDLSKLMPLITVAGEMWGKLELGPRPSRLPWGWLVQATLPQLGRAAAPGTRRPASLRHGKPPWKELASPCLQSSPLWGAGFDEGKAAQLLAPAGLPLHGTELESQSKERGGKRQLM